MLGPQPAPAGAMCAAHPEASADAVCTRCGNFMCTTCSDKRQGTLCPPCREALGTWPFTRADYDFSRVFNTVFSTWKRDIVMLGLCGAVMMGLTFIGQMVMQVFMMAAQAVLIGGGKDAVGPGIAVMVIGMFAGIGVTVLVQGIGIMGLIRVTMDSLLGRKVEVPRVFSQARKVWRYAAVQLLLGVGLVVPMVLGFGLLFAVSILIGGGGFSGDGIRHAFDGPAPIIVMALGSLGLIGLLVWLVIPLNLAQFELVYDDVDAVEAIRRAWQLGHGHRLSIFGFNFVGAMAMLALVVVGFLALCVGSMIAMPVGYALFFMLQAGLYLALRNGSGLPPPAEQK